MIADYYALNEKWDDKSARVFLHQLPIAFSACGATHPFALWLGMQLGGIRTFVTKLGATAEFAQASAICAALEAAANKQRVALQACAEM